MTTAQNLQPTLHAPCVCQDPDLERLRDLIAAGWDQAAASRLLWGDDVRAYVQSRLAALVPWLRFPIPPPPTRPTTVHDTQEER